MKSVIRKKVGVFAKFFEISSNKSILFTDNKQLHCYQKATVLPLHFTEEYTYYMNEGYT